MIDFDEKGYVNQKALAKKIINALILPCEKVKKLCLNLCTEIDEIELKMESSKSVKDINLYSKKLTAKNKILVKYLAIKDRLERIIKRNEDRIKYIDTVLSKNGIYNEKVNGSDLSKMEQNELFNISGESFNLNSKNEGKVVYKFFVGERFLFDGNHLDFSNEHNRTALMNLSKDSLHEVVSYYPSGVSTVDAEMLANTTFKQNLLKEIAVFVTEQSKKRSFKEINSMLGGLLSFKTEITESVDSFMAGVQNLFNVMVRGTLIKKFPNQSDEISRKLKCNEKSELIPVQIRESLLAGGLLSDATLTDEELSEEIRINAEKENTKNSQIAENLSNQFENQQKENEKREQDNKQKQEMVENAEEKDAENFDELQSLLSLFKGDDED